MEGWPLLTAGLPLLRDIFMIKMRAYTILTKTVKTQTCYHHIQSRNSPYEYPIPMLTDSESIERLWKLNGPSTTSPKSVLDIRFHTNLTDCIYLTASILSCFSCHFIDAFHSNLFSLETLIHSLMITIITLKMHTWDDVLFLLHHKGPSFFCSLKLYLLAAIVCAKTELVLFTW